MSSLFIFARSRNSFLTFFLSYRVWVTSKILVNFRFKRISVFMFPGSSNSVLAFLLRCHVWVTSNISRNPLYMSYFLWVISKTFRTGSCFGLSKSFKHGSSVDMSANDSLTLETYILKILGKSIRYNHQYFWVVLEPEVDPDFRGHPNEIAPRECQQWIP